MRHEPLERGRAGLGAEMTERQRAGRDNLAAADSVHATLQVLAELDDAGLDLVGWPVEQEPERERARFHLEQGAVAG